MSLSNAFNSILANVTSDFDWYRGNVVFNNVKMALSNYSRNKNGPEEITMEGREFVISFKETENTHGRPKKGDIFVSTSYGENMVDSLEELRGLKGEILGYRVRTN